jgi:uncharacterized protein (DUF1501 family)
MTTNPNAYSRRDLLKNGLLMASAAMTVPMFVQASALAMQQQAGDLSSVPGVPDERILVVLQLSGGNDGLNTVIPFGSPEYYKARPGIAIAEKDVLVLDKRAGVGLHPALSSLKDMHDNGMVGIYQGAGYPNPNRSHFKSMDIWHTADTSATGEGWLGRYLDSECCGFGKGESGRAPAAQEGAAGLVTDALGGNPASIAIGRTAPLALHGRVSQPTSFESADLFRWVAEDADPALAKAYEELNMRGAPALAKGDAKGRGEGDTNADFLLRTAMDAQVSSDLIRQAVAVTPLVTYPQGGVSGEIARQLQMVAAMIRAGLKTRVYYVSLGSFDTHAGQGGSQGRHAQLLKAFGDSVKAFYEDLTKQGNHTRVLTMVFSEFGRRVGQNASGGTDHGTAAPMFVVGQSVRQGLVGEHPSMKDLDDGDLRYTLDFRSVYAGVLDQWMKADSKKVLEAKVRAAQVVKGA